MAAVLLCVCVFLVFSGQTLAKYEPTWESLDARPLPAWYDEAKFGIFIHWGVFSVPSFGSEWFWNYWNNRYPAYVDFMQRNYPPGFTYQDFAPLFTAEFFDPNVWSEVLSASGAKYVVLTTKHHEGFTLWDSPRSWNWNSVSVGPKLDLVSAFSSALRAHTDLRLGLYHSLFEWFHPLFLLDQHNTFSTDLFPTTKTLPELQDLVLRFKPDLVWADGDGNAPDSYWNSTGFLAWLYNDSPVRDTVVTNDRWGSGSICRHGGFYTCSDRFQPGHLLRHKWENCMTIDQKSWGYRREARLQDYLSSKQLVSTLVETVACGGNLLMNIGPTHDGRIAPIFEERLRDVGAWLKVNGGGVYNSTTWRRQNDTVTADIWYTCNLQQQQIFAFLLQWPESGTVVLTDPMVTEGVTQVQLLGYGPVQFSPIKPSGLKVVLPSLTLQQMPCQWAWTLEISGAK